MCGRNRRGEMSPPTSKGRCRLFSNLSFVFLSPSLSLKLTHEHAHTHTLPLLVAFTLSHGVVFGTKSPFNAGLDVDRHLDYLMIIQSFHSLPVSLDVDVIVCVPS